MNNNKDMPVLREGTPAPLLKAWQPPRIEDADISTLTAGGGTSGVEGTSFLKTGS